MVKLYDEGIYLVNGTEIVPESEGAKVQALTGKAADKEEAKKGTMACSILSAHNTSGDMEHLKLKFDAKMCIRDRALSGDKGIYPGKQFQGAGKNDAVS